MMIRTAMRSGFTMLILALSSLSVGATEGQFVGTVEHARLDGVQHLNGELFHVQGLELSARRIWVTSVDQAHHRGYLHLFDRATGTLLRRLELTDGARYHPGGISLSGQSLWVPVAEMRPDSSAVLLQIDTESLRVRRRIAVPDHLGCVAAAGRMLVAGNWDSRLLYIFDLAGKGSVRAVPNPSPTHYQDMKFRNGQLVAGGSLDWLSGTVDWIDWPGLKLVRSLHAGAVGPVRPFGRGGPLTGEGMAIEGRTLYLIPEDGPSRLFRYTLD